MVAINDIIQIGEQTGLTSYHVYTSTSQAIATHSNTKAVETTYHKALTAIVVLNDVLDNLFITVDEPKQKQLIGILKAAIDFVKMNIGLVEQSTLKSQLAHITSEIKEQLEFTTEILDDLVLVHLKMPKMKPFKYSKEFRATFV